ncbi:DUF1330 domain-containing protein [Nonomuraea phyllanthi]|uniref:DUF1330 domain-containing protein n=1 Tax=Nonomuraea phyllanthi TaxID=2219224 RepID=A0A5C4WV33_9ACTN|nr:DUF1330 domain-containing protein [Nonomuraea phyllanthi]KAB8197460.1 DUF1330 domain-containing protein [Nonomuraea phyllanthi]QFY06547.1 DUF1330 domain-containing protein [Nonomuraea phyllanthi]
MSAYLIATVRATGNAEELAEYRRRVGATIEPYGGRYLARGEPVAVLEGEWDGAQVVVVEFPDVAAARAWNDSAAYREIAPLRARNTLSVRVIVDG